jgi:hypothetical protein
MPRGEVGKSTVFSAARLGPGERNLRMRTLEEIAEEVSRLKSLHPSGKGYVSAERVQQLINIAIEELEDGIDRTAGEWEELDDSFQDQANQALFWKEGTSDVRPSTGWGHLVKEKI